MAEDDGNLTPEGGGKKSPKKPKATSPKKPIRQWLDIRPKGAELSGKVVSNESGRKNRGGRTSAPIDWKPVFLYHLGLRGNVARACRVAGVSRVAVYAAREADEEFALGWAVALRTAGDILEEEAWRRGVEGVDKVTIQGGVAIKSKEYDGHLLAMLLKAAKPDKYRSKEPGRIKLTPELARTMTREQLNLIQQGVPVAVVLTMRDQPKQIAAPKPPEATEQ